MEKKVIKRMAMLLMAASLLLLSGCSDIFTTRIMADVESPDAVLRNYFEALQACEYGRCGNYLANHETFLVKDNTEYGIVLPLTNKCMEHLSYEEIGDCHIHNLEASRSIRVTALDMDALFKAIEENYMPLEYDYLTYHGKRNIDKERDKEDVGHIIGIAIDSYGNSVGTVSSDVTVHFVFEEGRWKIRQDANLVRAIFGDDSYA